MNMDTRIKLGIIFKLKVPEIVRLKVSSALQSPLHLSSVSMLKLGTDNTFSRYILTRNLYETDASVPPQVEYTVFHNVMGTDTTTFTIMAYCV